MKKASKATLPRSAAASATCAMGSSTLSNFACWLFFSITRLLPFSRMTRSSFGRLNAAVCTPRLPSPAEYTVFTTAIGASAPSAGLRYLGSIGRWFSISCRAPANCCSFADSGGVLDRDERLEGRLVVEPLVLVDLVRADGRLDRGVELHPLDVAVVVVVRQERGRASQQVGLQRGLRGELRGRVQVTRGHRQFALVLDVVGHGDQLAGSAAPDRREEAGGRLARAGGAAWPATFDLRLRGVRGIVVGRRGLGRRAGHERLVVIEPRPRPLVDEEVAEPRPAERVVVGDERRQHRLVAGPHLAQEERVHHLRRPHHVRQGAALGVGQGRDVGRQVGRREPRRLAGERGPTGSGGGHDPGRRRRRGTASRRAACGGRSVPERKAEDRDMGWKEKEGTVASARRTAEQVPGIGAEPFDRLVPHLGRGTAEDAGRRPPARSATTTARAPRRAGRPTSRRSRPAPSRRGRAAIAAPANRRGRRRQEHAVGHLGGVVVERGVTVSTHARIGSTGPPANRKTSSRILSAGTVCTISCAGSAWDGSGLGRTRPRCRTRRAAPRCARSSGLPAAASR